MVQKYQFLSLLLVYLENRSLKPPISKCQKDLLFDTGMEASVQHSTYITGIAQITSAP